ncbi:MAG: hypothetical protein FJZ16_09730 [Candidatus Omnitrophica bacterium]|nr:hypothetical protein [Candidatus Omnitrophota bacterium]
MNVITKDGLKKLGFRGFYKIDYLQNRGFPKDKHLLKCGVYVIVATKNYRPTYLPLSKVKSSHNVISPWPISRLKKKWVNNVETLYIGLAGSRSPRSLKKRLMDLIRHSLGKTSRKGPHRGGEIIWQLTGYQKFEVGYIPTDNPPAPKQKEEYLLRLFLQTKKGKLPFANRKLS